MVQSKSQPAVNVQSSRVVPNPPDRALIKYDGMPSKLLIETLTKLYSVHEKLWLARIPLFTKKNRGIHNGLVGNPTDALSREKKRQAAVTDAPNLLPHNLVCLATLA
jgi:hypothetical protein